jgi:sec-independent protein translocase protein TatA
MTPAFMSFGFSELLLVGVVALLVFGGNLPDVMRTLGRSYAKFRQSLHELSRPVRDEMREITTLPPRVPPVAKDEKTPYPEYPDYEEARALAEADAKPAVEGAAPSARPEVEIDEPPPV